MKRFICVSFMLVGGACPFYGQTGAHRIGQVLVKGNGITANVVPYASIKVCVAGTQCSTISPVYSDQSLTHVLPQPISADASGNYNYYTPAGCVDELISAPGSPNQLISNVCPSTGMVGTGSVNSVSVATANGFQGTVANPTSTPVISMNVDGTHYLPTTTDQTNWNGKQAALGFTPENVANKDAASGYAGLTSGALLKTNEFPAFTGDAVSTAGTTVLTLATVNSGSGSCGDATHVCEITTNAKGLVTAQTPITLSGLSTLSVGDLSPLFTSTVTNPTTTPSVTFMQSPAPINSVFAGAPSGSAVAPTFQTSPTFSAANLTNFPTFNQNTTGTASNLSGTPALPNGTTATTQTVGDNSTKLATTAFVLTNRGTGTVTHTAGALTSNQFVIGNSAADVKVDPSAGTDGAGNITAVSISTTGSGGFGGGYSGLEGIALSGSSGHDAIWADSTSHRFKMNNNNGGASTVAGMLSGVTGTITGTSLSATCDSGTVTVTGSVVGSPVIVSSTTGADVGGSFYLRASVTAAGTVTVYVCGTGTPASLAYNVAVIQ